MTQLRRPFAHWAAWPTPEKQAAFSMMLAHPPGPRTAPSSMTAPSFARLGPERLNVASAFDHLVAGREQIGVLRVHVPDGGKVALVEGRLKRIVELLDGGFVLSRGWCDQQN